MVIYIKPLNKKPDKALGSDSRGCAQGSQQLFRDCGLRLRAQGTLCDVAAVTMGLLLAQFTSDAAE